jgi:hypothetical protein
MILEGELIPQLGSSFLVTAVVVLTIVIICSSVSDAAIDRQDVSHG